ncbi:extracellular matrix protein 1 [Cygnus atratus]|uniref:extracellular matrix protein 1 n=1 Tax=Cygnus atratus TaxID=8868 RepID=UPI0015D5C572|nr:extracellular matrix protein 1 [Cygnus atratus]
MAALGLLFLLLLGTAVAVKPRHPVAQEQLNQQPYDIQQVMQEEQDIELPRDVVEAAKNPPQPRAPSSPDSPDAIDASSWGSTLEGFPPAWPLPDALDRYCRSPTLIPRAPRPSLPPAAFAHLRRQVDALDAFWPRLDGCCRRPSPLPCARRAWTDVLDGFCDDEFGVKTRQFHCCRRHGAARRRCFADATAAATAATQITEVTVWDVSSEPSFPPGEPTATNMDNICRLRGLRPGPRGLPGPRARFHTRLERDFGRCCHNASLECAHAAWQKGLDRYCREEGVVKTGQHRCCQRGGGRARGRCFAAAAPHPAYDRELHNVSLARLGPAMLRTLCGPMRLLSKKRPVPELLEAVTSACCALPPEEQSPCAEEQLSQSIDDICTSWRDPRACCLRGGPERHRCFTERYLGGVPLAAAVPPPAPGHPQ